jgi:hypothetical protein
MTRTNMWETPALFLLVASTIVMTTGVPISTWRTSFADPCHLATVSAIVVVMVLIVTHSFGDRGIRFERTMLALFLAGMPLVYVASWAWSRPSGASVGWLWIEIVGVPVYATLAVLGHSSPWLLAVGIAAHGLCWDSWHYGRTAFVPDWYAVGCFVMDVTLAIYVATRLRVAASGPAELPALQAAEATDSLPDRRRVASWRGPRSSKPV